MYTRRHGNDQRKWWRRKMWNAHIGRRRWPCFLFWSERWSKWLAEAQAPFASVHIVVPGLCLALSIPGGREGASLGAAEVGSVPANTSNGKSQLLITERHLHLQVLLM
ncbi:hypothetical protein Mapa_011409 [Marchantia paleacea]|nr:hypothetical protein Mapa_011409 [Marchantia paleacea]